MFNTINREKTNVPTREAVNMLNCTFCWGVITSENYRQATDEFKKRVEQEFREQFEGYKKEFEDHISELEKKHRLEVQHIQRIQKDQKFRRQAL